VGDQRPGDGRGLRDAVAYAVAEQLGFSEDEVEWMVVPFNLSFRPGPKDFDFDINQVSYVEKRDRAVDFSDSYYDVNQAVVTLGSSDFADAASVADLQARSSERLWERRATTTSSRTSSRARTLPFTTP
jgi:polar amino acid transport system substrate-binding protein